VIDTDQRHIEARCFGCLIFITFLLGLVAGIGIFGDFSDNKVPTFAGYIVRIVLILFGIGGFIAIFTKVINAIRRNGLQGIMDEFKERK
jgi:cytochrome bd-type quinol oxidase subunit 1